MKPTSKLFTISQAAKELGYSSRSTLYRLIKKGYLDKYLWTNGTKQFLELKFGETISVIDDKITNFKFKKTDFNLSNFEDNTTTQFDSQSAVLIAQLQYDGLQGWNPNEKAVLQSVANLNGSGNNYITLSLGKISFDKITFTQSADTLILMH